NGKVQLAPADLLERAKALESEFEHELAHLNDLKIVQKRERFSHNSWAHNVKEFIKGDRHSNYLYIHSEDARTRQLDDGDTARVSANGRTVEVPVKIDDDMSPGCVAIPHGWGHQQAEGLSTARHTTGVNVNIIMPDGPGSIEPISGMSHMNGVIVDVERVATSA
ncbi:MAG: molybdopterin dinucleotide binding domain-containing protein, partial [Halioglobus sp.]